MQINLNNREVEYLKKSFKERMCRSYDPHVNNILIGILKKLDKKPIKVSSRKAKGRNLQKWVCIRIAKIAGIEYNQQDDECMVHSREMGQPGCDVVLRDNLAKYLRLSIECKSAERFNLMATIEQAIKNKKIGSDWAIVYKNKALKIPVTIVPWKIFEGYMKNILSIFVF